MIETHPPADMDKDCIFPEYELSFRSKISLPSYEEFYTYNEDFCSQIIKSDSDLDIYDIYHSERKKYGCKVEDDYNISKLLGFADIAQAPMLEQCEMVTNGIYHGDSSSLENFTEEEKQIFFKNSSEWILLFQMGTIEDKIIQVTFH